MRKEIADLELEQVNGGRYYVHIKKKMVCWDTIDGVYNLKCSPYVAMEAMDELSGKFANKAEYDKACFDLLKHNGWI